ncbi:MAG: MerR family transcriptional regulator [Eubacteriales bacterium]|nr:MerR family transcriptional regulator [Eubacteriales bacterium]
MGNSYPGRCRTDEIHVRKGTGWINLCLERYRMDMEILDKELVGMRISEVANLTGLSVSNIRFYEKKGLLTPDREVESKYRDYSEEDVKRLKEIILYRKINMPIETIYLLLKGEVSAESVLKRQEEELTAQKEMLQGSIDLCRRLLKEENPENLDIDYFLNYVKEEEEKGTRFAEIDELLEDFAEFTHLSKFRGDPYIGKFLNNVWVMRAITFIWMIVCIVTPVAVLAERQADGTITAGTIVYWIGWILLGSIAFLQFRKLKR